MRFYSISITDENGKPVKLDGNAILSSHNSYNFLKPGAFAIEFDLPVYAADIPAGDGLLKIYGLSLEQLNQASTLNLKNIRIEAGMMPGFPLATEQAFAKPQRRGVIFEGSIKQAFGTWQGTEQSLDLLVSVQLTAKPTDKPVTTRSIFFECKKEESFSGAIQKAMKNVDIDAQIAIDSRLVASVPIRFMADNMEAFALSLKRQSKRIILDSGYIGITTVRRIGGYNFTDNSTPGTKIPVLFNDLIGQPVWLDVLQVQMKLVMRADIIVGSTIEMPKDYIAINRARILGTVKDKIEFTGNAFVNKVRHVGTSRQPDANSWVTIIDAILTTK